MRQFDAIVLTVSHRQFLDLDLTSLKNRNSLIYDVKGILGNKADAKL